MTCLPSAVLPEAPSSTELDGDGRHPLRAQNKLLAAAASEARLVAGRYRLRELLGRGGMGRVWLAEDELLHRPVALKQDLLSDPAPHGSGPAVAGHALTEASLAARVNHVGAITVYDLVVDDSYHWIVMEPLFGRSLAEAIAEESRLSVARVATLGLRLLEVLQATHRAGVVHCDVKPANVHLGNDGRVVLTDFGIAQRMPDDPAETTEMVAASPAYASPERLNGGRAGPASDLFSLGATLFAAVEGRPPFRGTALFDTLVAVVQGEPVSFLHAGPLRAVLEALLAKEPGDRPTAEQARLALVKVQRELHRHHRAAVRGLENAVGSPPRTLAPTSAA